MGYFKVISKEDNNLRFEIGCLEKGRMTPEKLYNILIDSLQLITFPDEITDIEYSPEITRQMQEKALMSLLKQTFDEYVNEETGEKINFTAGELPSATGDERYLSKYVPLAIKNVRLISEQKNLDGSEVYGSLSRPIFWKGEYLAEFTNKQWFDFLPENWKKEIFLF